MIPEPGDTNREEPVNETFHVQTNDELTKNELKQIEADDQAIQTILLSLLEHIYADVDSCETAQEIWLQVQQMMKGSDIGIQVKKAKLFNEWERFTSNDKESIESYYHRFLKLMNDLKRNKHFSEKIARNANQNGNGNLVAARAEGNAAGYNGNQIRCYNSAADLDEIDEVNANCILMANLQQASTSGTQTDKALVYDSDGSAEVTSVEQSGETVEQHPVNVEETRVLYDSLYHNLAIKVEKVNLVNRKLKETNAELTTELARFKNQEKCFEISQEKYDKLERYLTKQLSKEKSTVSFLLEEKKKLKSDFKIYEDELLDKQIQLEKRIKELDNILVKIATFVGDFKSLAKEVDESLAKHKALELEIERENEYAKHWNDWYKKCEECKFDKISYDKAYNDMQQKIERLQAQLGDLKGKSKDTSCVTDTLNPLSQKPENENVELEF
uniref:Uncharacterized protein n=1 Tax=Tanacetum cinerariifolium TaxID=118510 RepID=A0A6L2NXJ5_TANCI|nr:hypothetical protein [Tanacetum cinerariifolium]